MAFKFEFISPTETMLELGFEPLHFDNFFSPFDSMLQFDNIFNSRVSDGQLSPNEVFTSRPKSKRVCKRRALRSDSCEARCVKKRSGPDQSLTNNKISKEVNSPKNTAKFSCPVCYTTDELMVLDCGHLICKSCDNRLFKMPLYKCAVCNKKPTARPIKIYGC